MSWAAPGGRPPLGSTSRLAIVLAAALAVLTGGLFWFPARVLAPYLLLALSVWGGRWLGWAGGLAVGAVAGGAAEVVALRGASGALGPAAQPWWLPGAFYALLGLAAGVDMRRSRRKLAGERASRQELARVHARTLVACAGLVARRDQETAYHCERVAENACNIGRAVGLPERELNSLFWAGMLHDLGKVSVPTTILLKEEGLTQEEFEVVKRHPVVGAELLLDISPRFQAIAEGVRSHHERWDGSGYPDGLAGERIPLFGRIVAVADVFEAMTAPRPYHAPLPPKAAMRHLEERAGLEFDPRLVELAGELREKRLLLTQNDDYNALTNRNSDIFSTGFWLDRDEAEAAD